MIPEELGKSRVYIGFRYASIKRIFPLGKFNKSPVNPLFILDCENLYLPIFTYMAGYEIAGTGIVVEPHFAFSRYICLDFSLSKAIRFSPEYHK